MFQPEGSVSCGALTRLGLHRCSDCVETACHEVPPEALSSIQCTALETHRLRHALEGCLFPSARVPSIRPSYLPCLLGGLAAQWIPTGGGLAQAAPSRDHLLTSDLSQQRPPSSLVSFLALVWVLAPAPAPISFLPEGVPEGCTSFPLSSLQLPPRFLLCCLHACQECRGIRGRGHRKCLPSSDTAPAVGEGREREQQEVG